MFGMGGRMRGLRFSLTALIVLTATTSANSGSITINGSVATGTITNGANITVTGWVYGAQNFGDPKAVTPVTTVKVNKVFIYLFYQQTRPGSGNAPSPRYTLDGSQANFSLGSSPDSDYSGSVNANMPEQASTTISSNCWFLHVEARLDTAAKPDVLVDSVEKTVDLVWSIRKEGS